MRERRLADVGLCWLMAYRVLLGRGSGPELGLMSEGTTVVVRTTNQSICGVREREVVWLGREERNGMEERERKGKERKEKKRKMMISY